MVLRNTIASLFVMFATCLVQGEDIPMTWEEFYELTGETEAAYEQYLADFYVYHPADTDQDHQISTEELNAYGQSWRYGETWSAHDDQEIPIDSLTQAAYFQWKFDGYYFYSSESGSFTEGTNDTFLVSPGGNSTLSTQYHIYKPARVTVALNQPEKSWTAGAIEEILPDGWTAETYLEIWEKNGTRWPTMDIEREDDNLGALVITEQGGRCIVRWGPFQSSEYDLDYRYALKSAGETLPLNEDFSGVQSYDGTSRPTLARAIEPAFEFFYPQFNDYGVNISNADVEIPNVDFSGDDNGDGVSNFATWLMTGDPATRVEKLRPTFERFTEDGAEKIRYRFYETVESFYAPRLILCSSDLKVWRKVTDPIINRRPDLDVGGALAQEAIIPGESYPENFFCLLYRDDFYREARPLITPGTLTLIPYRSNGGDSEGSREIVLSHSQTAFSLSVPGHENAVFDLRHSGIDEVIVNPSGDSYPVNSGKKLRIGNSGGSPLEVRRVDNAMVVENHAGKANCSIDGAYFIETPPVFVFPDPPETDF
ncbi:hypothetical protein [Cerasicoccus maritimus]|uniref:hypothetical protein n=1 Tax=Cerasicoccus maritimus TaxID=490089 RepID=UPI002852D4D7|nr:hypothetical protein [Cerasicoccus maritimus]